MQGCLLLVFAKYFHLPFLRDIQTDCTRTGLGGYWGNKGGVSIRLALFGHMVCFLNCHLPAHMENSDQRVDNFESILQLQQFQGPLANGVLDHEYVPSGVSAPRCPLSPAFGISDGSYPYWRCIIAKKRVSCEMLLIGNKLT
ncbi:hypothetical protein FKM82_026898 [Ascaphus truei]